MTTPGREKLRGRREEQKVRALAAIEPSSSRLNSNGGRGSIVRAAEKEKTKQPFEAGRKAMNVRFLARCYWGSPVSPGRRGRMAASASIKANAL